MGKDEKEGSVVDAVHAATNDIRAGALSVPFKDAAERTPHLADFVQVRNMRLRTRH